MAIILGNHRIDGPLFLAPMAGVTDRAFRELCREFGANYAVAEMVASQPQLRETAKSRSRMIFGENESPRVVQLLGADPVLLEKAFYWAAEAGADVIDFNMGCPAKKVCSVACGSALMRDEAQAQAILEALGRASQTVDIPVTLKCRTGWDEAHKNALTITKMAQDNGFRLVTVHGRTRAGGFVSPVEYDTIAEVVSKLTIPVVANGDITTGEEAKRVLDYTGAAAVMVGRAAMGQPWIFQEMKAVLSGQKVVSLTMKEKAQTILKHQDWHFADYDELTAVRNFRKHLLWYLKDFDNFESVREVLCRAETAQEQKALLRQYFAEQGWLS